MYVNIAIVDFVNEINVAALIVTSCRRSHSFSLSPRRTKWALVIIALEAAFCAYNSAHQRLRVVGACVYHVYHNVKCLSYDRLLLTRGGNIANLSKNSSPEC